MSNIESDMSKLKIDTSEGDTGQMKLSAYFSKPPVSGDADIFDTITSTTSDNVESGEIKPELPVDIQSEVDTTAIEAQDTGPPKVTGSFNTIVPSETDCSKNSSELPVFTFFSKNSGESSILSERTAVHCALLTDAELSLESLSVSPAQTSEPDVEHNLWIPSSRTATALQEMRTSPGGTYFPDKDLLTMPGIMLQEEMADPVGQLLSHYCGEEVAAGRTVLTADAVTQDDRGLRQLIQAGCYCAAVNLTGRLLAMYGQGLGKAGHMSKHTPHSLQFWFVRLSLLISLRQFSIAQLEATPFTMDNPDMYFEWLPELHGGRKGSMIPFHMRLLMARLAGMLGRHRETLEQLFEIKSRCSSIVAGLQEGPALELWRRRELETHYYIISSATQSKDYNLAVRLLEEAVESAPSQRRDLYSAMAKLYLQMGDIQQTQKYMSLTSSLCTGSPEDAALVQMNLGFLSVANNQFTEALTHYTAAATTHQYNPTIVNNMAVCLLYLGRLKEAIALMEEHIKSSPECYLHEGLLYNICSLYELDSLASLTSKQEMLKLVAKHKGDGFNVTCFKF